MAHMFKHSSLGVALQFIFTGEISYSHQLKDMEKGPDVCPCNSHLSAPQDSPTESADMKAKSTTADSHRLINWHGHDDPDNPQNWSTCQKGWISALINLYTFTVYVGSSLYTSGQEAVIETFHVSNTEGALGLALYVLGYGTGCLLLSPLTEVPAIGRNPPYAVSALLFLILCIPTGLVQNYAGLMVLRFLLGLMASPPLATAGASLSDIWAPSNFPVAIGIWSIVTAMAPSLGPTLSSYAVGNLGWRFASWELLIMAGPVTVLLLVSVPETSGLTILYYRAKRMRERPGMETAISEAELKTNKLTTASLLCNALVKPWEINAKDPALMFTTLYFGFVYGIYYTFFESLPLVFPVDYNFSAESTGLVFLGAIPSGILALAIHSTFMNRVAQRLREGTFGELEKLLVPGVVACWLIPAGLFLYAWGARPSVHWIAPVVGLATIMFAMYFVTQSIFAYIPSIYPHYAASIFAASSFARSVIAFAAILIARPMFEVIGIDGGVSLLGGLMVLCAFGMVFLWKFGKSLRARSRFAID